MPAGCRRSTSAGHADVGQHDIGMVLLDGRRAASTSSRWSSIRRMPARTIEDVLRDDHPQSHRSGSPTGRRVARPDRPQSRAARARRNAQHLRRAGEAVAGGGRAGPDADRAAARRRARRTPPRRCGRRRRTRRRAAPSSARSSATASGLARRPGQQLDDALARQHVGAGDVGGTAAQLVGRAGAVVGVRLAHVEHDARRLDLDPRPVAGPVGGVARRARAGGRAAACSCVGRARSCARRCAPCRAGRRSRRGRGSRSARGRRPCARTRRRPCVRAASTADGLEHARAAARRRRRGRRSAPARRRRRGRRAAGGRAPRRRVGERRPDRRRRRARRSVTASLGRAPSRSARKRSAQVCTSLPRTTSRSRAIRARRSWRFISTAVTIASRSAPLVVRVDEHGVGQLVGGAGELRQHEHAVAVEAGRDVLLGDQVHAVAQRRHEHHVAGAVEGDELVERQRLVQVVDRRIAEPAVHAVDLADELLDLAPLVLVVLDALARRRGDLHHHAALGVERAVVEQRLVRPQALADALRVVEAVDAEQHDLRLAEAGAVAVRALAGRPPGGDGLELVDVDRDRVRRRPACCRPSSSSHTTTKLAALIARWNPTRSHAEQAGGDLGAPRQPHEQLDRRERDVEEEADDEVGPLVAQHLRHELQVVVVDPHDRLVGGDLGERVGEALVDGLVGRPVRRRCRSSRAGRRGTAATACRWRSPRSSPAPRRRVTSDRVQVDAVVVNGSGASSASPVQPTHVPPLARSSGSRARTRPPGLGAQPSVGARHRAAGWRRRRSGAASATGGASVGAVGGRSTRRARPCRRVSRSVASCQRSERLLEVGDEVGGRLDADGEPDAGWPAPRAASRRRRRGSSRRGARSGSRPRRATRRA